MVSRRFVMNRRLFSYSELPLATPFRLLRLVKRKVWPLPCSHTLSQPWLCSRGDLPIAFRGTVIFSATFPSLTASPLSFVAVLTRSSCPFVPMMQSTLPNNSAQVFSYCRYLAEVSHHWERPLRPASGFHIGFALQ